MRRRIVLCPAHGRGAPCGLSTPPPLEDPPLTNIQRPSLPETSLTSRRAALLSVPSLASAIVLMMGAGAEVTHAASSETPVDWASVRKDIIEVIADPKSPGGIGEKGPTLVRLGRSCVLRRS